jgi:hypothetical protein
VVAVVVVEFAKLNGFPKAELLIWNSNNPDTPATCVEELIADEDLLPGDEREISIGLHLGTDLKVVVDSINEETDEAEWRLTL